MTPLPSGTVTLLFSDIEGSTSVLSRLGPRWGEALVAHRTLLRDGFDRHGGHELGTEGDSFLVAFPTAGAAIRAAVDGQRALAEHSWPQDTPVRVRMGLHTGEPTPLEDGYVGLDVHIGARVAAAAHGGQVVLSEASCRLVRLDLPDGVDIRDLGLHRLKDLPDPVHVHQLVIAGLPDAFPPLRSLGAATNLPRPPTPMIDRVEPLDQLRTLLNGAGARLVTVTGPGGSGKSRLAVAAAAAAQREFDGGTYFVELGAGGEGRDLWGALADVVGAVGDGPARDRTAQWLAGTDALLVLDNLESVPDVASEVAALLGAAPQVTVLATSRRALRVQGEHVLPVSPLALPADVSSLDAVRGSYAVQLFVQQARMVRPDFTLTSDNAADVAAICARLDGLPLAIELAAARVTLLSPRALLRRLDDRLGLSDRAQRPSRQRTLRDTIAWSYDLLDPELQASFRSLGVCAGGCDLEALQMIAAGDADALEVAEELLDVSLVWVRDTVDGEPRVGMLGTVREYALERLEQAGELWEARRRHAEHFLDLVREATAGGTTYSPSVLDKLDLEQDNLREALAWCFGDGPDPTSRLSIGVRIAAVLTKFWYRRGYVAEARHWFELAVHRSGGTEGEDVADALHGLGVFLQQQGENPAALRLFERALEMGERTGDPDRVTRELNSLGITRRALSDSAGARSALQRSLDSAREHAFTSRIPPALTNLALLELETDTGRPEVALDLLTEALAIDTVLDDPWAVVVDRVNIAAALLRGGRGQEAGRSLLEVLDDVLEIDDLDVLANLVEVLAAVAAADGDPLRAGTLIGAAGRTRRDIGIPLTELEWRFLERWLGPARADVPREQWDAAERRGAELSRDELVSALRAARTARPSRPG